MIDKLVPVQSAGAVAGTAVTNMIEVDEALGIVARGLGVIEHAELFHLLAHSAE